MILDLSEKGCIRSPLYFAAKKASKTKTVTKVLIFQTGVTKNCEKGRIVKKWTKCIDLALRF